jgi:omega-hydroxy-beta-dihydromenaquinone-9 sulfotransferase
MRDRLKRRWSVANNYLAGITAGDWWRLLRENRFAVSPTYWHRAAFITLASLVNSHFRKREERQYKDQIEQVEIQQAPLFILGHWRSGTTLLHYLMAQDTERFAFANTYQVVNPHTFLCTEEINTRRFARLVPATRPMDNMRQGFDTPQEDEFAPLLMTLRSLYLGISFPQHEAQYANYLTFEKVPAEVIDEWKRAVLWFCKKLTFKYRRQLVLKSPPHTGRIRLLLEIFPQAKFVHIHRDPYRVFQSQRHYFDTAIWYTYLQRPDRSLIDTGILQRYNTMYDAFFKDREQISGSQFHEVRFDDLERDPIGEVRRIYAQLDLGSFAKVESKLRAYVDSLASYGKNEFAPLAEADRHRVAESWSRGFEAWNYPVNGRPS